MKKNRGNKVKIEFDEITLWKLGTIIFGILFVLSHFSGNGGSVSDDSGAAIPSAPQAAPQAPSPVDVEIGDAYVKGNKNAEVTIIEYSDFECPFCARFYTQTFGQLEKEYIDTGKVKLAFKHLPLPFHANAQKASEAAECAGEVEGTDAFWDMHDAIFENQATGMEITDLKRMAGDLGIDQTKFDSCLDNGDMADEVKAHAAEAAKLGASGTPSFFINGVKVVGAQPFSVFKTTIDAALN